MDTATIAAYKARLEAEKEKLVSELSTIGRINPDNPGDWEATPSDMTDRASDLNDFADNIEAYETNSAVLKQLETQLGDVEAALMKIEEGTFGICEVNGEEIEEGRLNANPAARTCTEHMQVR